MVNVWGSCKLITGCPVPSPFELAVVHNNGLGIPCHLASKDIPNAVCILLLCTAVVDDNIGKHFQATALKLGHTPVTCAQMSVMGDFMACDSKHRQMHSGTALMLKSQHLCQGHLPTTSAGNKSELHWKIPNLRNFGLKMACTDNKQA